MTTLELLTITGTQEELDAIVDEMATAYGYQEMVDIPPSLELVPNPVPKLAYVRGVIKAKAKQALTEVRRQAAYREVDANVEEPSL